jgi:hypothetical protein
LRARANALHRSRHFSRLNLEIPPRFPKDGLLFKIWFSSIWGIWRDNFEKPALIRGSPTRRQLARVDESFNMILRCGSRFQNPNGPAAFAYWRPVQMRSFILACIAIAVIASTGAALLSHFQLSAKEQFSTEAVRL